MEPKRQGARIVMQQAGNARAMEAEMVQRVVGTALAATLAVVLTGCDVETHKQGNGEDVKVETPLGGLRVKTNGAVVLDGLGLQAYPGARPVKETENDKDKDSGAADVNMAFGGFQLRVKVVSFETDDSPEKVEAFYRDGMKRFGDVIECRDDGSGGGSTRTLEGLTCDRNEGVHLKVEDRAGRKKVELKAGSKQHQHIVSIDPEGNGTKFALVEVDLPGKFFSGQGDGEMQ